MDHKEEMQKKLREYINSLEMSLQSYKKGELPLKEYMVYVDQSNTWLKERCHANTSK